MTFDQFTQIVNLLWLLVLSNALRYMIWAAKTGADNTKVEQVIMPCIVVSLFILLSFLQLVK